MLSLNRSHIDRIEFKGCDFDKSINEDKIGIEESLQNVPEYLILTDELNFRYCNLTDDTFIPIVGFLKFVKNITILGDNKLTCKSLYGIIKVSLNMVHF